METTILRQPQLADGAELHRLVKRCPPLDENSRYCNLLQVSHFRDTSIVAEHDGRLIGFVTGYRLPEHPEVLFVWQVGVSPEGRGQGLAGRMLSALLDNHEDVRFLETTVTPDNEPSESLFRGLAERRSARVVTDLHFEHDRHFDGAHDSEVLYRIGPFRAGSQAHI